MSLTGMILKFAAAVPRMEEYDRFLFVGPHPDDLEIGAGASAAKWAAQGKQVFFLICLDGRFGEGLAGGLTGDALARKRREEAVRGAGALGVSRVFFLGRKTPGEKVRCCTPEEMETAEPVCDGGFYAQEDLIHGIAHAVSLLKPQVVLGPDPWSRSECHPDHLNTGKAVRQAACFAPYPGIMRGYMSEEPGLTPGAEVKAAGFYMTARPNQYVRTSGALLQKQFAAIREHGSQFPPDSGELRSVETYLRLRSLDFGLRRFGLHAEGFRVYGPTQMHCLPEAGE